MMRCIWEGIVLYLGGRGAVCLSHVVLGDCIIMMRYMGGNVRYLIVTVNIIHMLKSRCNYCCALAKTTY